jgi:energy-coupling factor transporter ATP-binding protein EcfA2
MALEPTALRQYFVFLASPGDVNSEREVARRFFDRYNRHTGELLGVRFEVVDWENYSTIGVGSPQDLITKQTLEKYAGSLALVIGIMGQRFGSPTATSESGTEDEFRWALQTFRERGSPEIKWFFRRVDQFTAPPDPDAISAALEQWQKVRAFHQELQQVPLFVAEYRDAIAFKEVFENDVMRWLQAPERPWISGAVHRERIRTTITPPDAYLQTIERDFRRLDIAGIDNDRAFEIPLSEIYVRLRVMFDEEAEGGSPKLDVGAPIDIQTALLRYENLVIVGDPGSGKSTFLKYVALMLSRAISTNDSAMAMEKLCLQPPLPLPLFVSCWDLSDFLKKRESIQLGTLLDFLQERLSASGFEVASGKINEFLASGSCFLLFDGLDEVPTDAGRGAVSRLLEDCVKNYGENRYLVTSRVRAYTGDTILQGSFARADIQPFDANDRAQFLRNWIALLFKVAPEDVSKENGDAYGEFQSVTSGIEANDRIRPLAVNPLLLTVIAIVHWNRKRLPEQRIDLYDECVDVLLGQRKEAEHVQLSRKTGALDQQHEQEQFEERAWIRKRFGEIALHILSGEMNRDEASKSEIVKLLTPRFLDKGAPSQEIAETRATYFLDRQELSSGLLVSRRAQSYRFVHLTFQEYLAAWYLSNQEFDQVIATIEAHLRQQKWFETLQLLGGEWAKQSDDKVDRYIAWLLDKQGKSLNERAPIIALCANIVRDIVGVAELKPETRKDFRTAVEGTLDAFRPSSGIAALTQLEILEALGQLGSAVKPHLITATKSSLYQVRRRAIEMLLPHLTDDEVFEMDHVLSDRSKEPIKTYLLSLLARDAHRAVVWIANRNRFGEKATDAFSEVMFHFKMKCPHDLFIDAVRGVFQKGTSYYGWYGYPSRSFLLGELKADEALLAAAIDDREAGVRARALALRVEKASKGIWDIVRNRAESDAATFVREQALKLLAVGQTDVPETWTLISEAAQDQTNVQIQVCALRLLATHKPATESMLEIVRNAAVNGINADVRSAAVQLLAETCPDEAENWKCLYQVAEKDSNVETRETALRGLWKRLSEHPQIRKLLARIATSDESSRIRRWAFWTVANATFNTSSMVLLSHDLDGLQPGLDLRERVTKKRVSEAATKLLSRDEEVRQRYEQIAETLRVELEIEIKLGWTS